MHSHLSLGEARPRGVLTSYVKPFSCSLGMMASLLILQAGCVSQHPGTAQPARSVEGTSAQFERRIDPFDVRDASGTPYDHPFLGGLNVPRPQFLDIDGDGDQDLILQEVTGEVMYFEHLTGQGDSRFVWRTDRFADLDVGEWNRFYDMDDDGDLDILAEQPFSYVRYYQNSGNAEQPRYTLMTDTLRDVQGVPIFSDRQNIPNLTDIDCDGLIDLFIGRIQGTVMRYEEVSKTNGGIPTFALVTERFEDIEIIGQFGTLHGANTLAFSDFDRDGDQDLFWGDFFEPGLLLIENTGTCSQPMLRNSPVPFPIINPMSTSGYNAPAFSDLDLDGDQDLFVGVLGGAFNPNLTAADNLYFYEHDTEGGFSLRTFRFIKGVDVGKESIPAFADLDDDGDQDLILSNKIDPGDFNAARAYYFENQGSADEPSFQLGDPLPFEAAYHYAPAIADLDADGDLDMLVGTWNKGLALYRNEGTQKSPNFVAVDTAYLKLTRGSNSSPALVDIDADGDLDLFVGESSGTLNYYQNEGTPQRAHFVLVSDEYDGIDVGRRSIPTFVDLDVDGDYDLIVGRESGGLAFYRNTGTTREPRFVPDSTFSLRVPAFAAPVFVDIDADGDQDFFSGGDGGGLVFYENRQVR